MYGLVESNSVAQRGGQPIYETCPNVAWRENDWTAKYKCEDKYHYVWICASFYYSFHDT